MVENLAKTLTDRRAQALEQGRIANADPGGGTAVLVGFPGASDKPNTARLYLTPDCSSAYVEYPTDAEIFSQDFSDSAGRAFGASSIFLPQGVKCTFNIAAPVDAADVDAFALKEKLVPALPGLGDGDGAANERWVGAAIGAATTAWNVAGQLGLQEPIKQGVGAALNKVGSWFKSLF